MSTVRIDVDSNVRERLRTFAVGRMTYSEIWTWLMDQHEMGGYVRAVQREADAAAKWFPARDL